MVQGGGHNVEYDLIMGMDGIRYVPVPNLVDFAMGDNVNGLHETGLLRS
ncbi:MAG: hypothetical protein AMXMBFR4_28090 [Candidatus Hydrogenedentota bacterium]